MFSRPTSASVCVAALAVGAVGLAGPASASPTALVPPTGLTASAPVRGLVQASWVGAPVTNGGKYVVKVSASNGTSVEKFTTETTADVPVSGVGPYDVTVEYRENGGRSAEDRVDDVVAPTQQLVLSRGTDTALAVPMDAGHQLKAPVELDLAGEVGLMYDRWRTWAAKPEGLTFGYIGSPQTGSIPGTTEVVGAPAPLVDDRLAYLKAATGGTELWVYDRTAETNRRVLEAGPYDMVRAAHLVGKVVVRRTTTDTGKSDLALVDLATGQVTSGGSMTEGVEDFDVSRRGGLFLTGTSGTRITSWQWPRPAQQFSVLWIYGRHRHLTWDPQGRSVSALVTVDGNTTLRVLDQSGGTISQIPAPTGVTGIRWSRDNQASPVVSGLTGPEATRSATATFTFAVDDADDPIGRVQTTCTVAGAADEGPVSGPCSSPFTTGTVSPGSHTLRVEAVVPDGGIGSATREWVRDTTAPVTQRPVLPMPFVGTSLTVPVSATDNVKVASYDTAVRYASVSGSMGAWQYPTASNWSGRPLSQPLTMTVRPGYRYCLAFRARDTVGNVGAWSAERCTSVVLDDRSLTASTGWTRATSSSYAYGTYSVARRAASTLTVQAKGTRVGVTALRCSTCGAVDVYWAGVYQGRVNLSGTTAYKVTTWLPTQKVTRSGAVVLKTVNTRAAAIDGVAVLH